MTQDHVSLTKLKRDLDVSAAELAKVKRVLGLVNEERELLSDELQVRHHMVLKLAEDQHQATTDAAEARASASAAETAMAALQARIAAAELLEAEAATLRRERGEMSKTMDEWKGKVKEALKENRVKEQQHVQTEVEQRSEIARLKEEIDRVNFQLEAAKLRGRAQEQMISSSAQTDELALPHATMRTSSPIGPSPSPPGSHRQYAASNSTGSSGAPHLQLPNTSFAGASHGGAAPLTPGLPMTPGLPIPSAASTGGQTPLVGPTPTPEQLTSPNPDGDAAARPPLATTTALPTPPAMVGPGSATAQEKPMIVTVHFGDADGWTVDTKHRAVPGVTVGVFKAQVCEQINSRFAKSVDCAQMCIKIHHARAGRHVTLSDHRDLHSFAFFHRCVEDGRPIKLQLEPLKPSEI